LGPFANGPYPVSAARDGFHWFEFPADCGEEEAENSNADIPPLTVSNGGINQCNKFYNLLKL